MTTTIRRTTVGAVAMALAIAAPPRGARGERIGGGPEALRRQGPVEERRLEDVQANTEQRGIVKFHVNGSTDFERVKGGFAGLDKGLKVEVTAKHTNNGWLAGRSSAGATTADAGVANRTRREIEHEEDPAHGADAGPAGGRRNGRLRRHRR